MIAPGTRHRPSLPQGTKTNKNTKHHIASDTDCQQERVQELGQPRATIFLTCVRRCAIIQRGATWGFQPWAKCSLPHKIKRDRNKDLRFFGQVPKVCILSLKTLSPPPHSISARTGPALLLKVVLIICGCLLVDAEIH